MGVLLFKLHIMYNQVFYAIYSLISCFLLFFHPFFALQRVAGSKHFMEFQPFIL